MYKKMIRSKEKVKKLQKKGTSFRETTKTDKKLDNVVQFNTLNTYIQELKCEIDNLIAEKDDMVED